MIGFPRPKLATKAVGMWATPVRTSKPADRSLSTNSAAERCSSSPNSA